MLAVKLLSACWQSSCCQHAGSQAVVSMLAIKLLSACWQSSCCQHAGNQAVVSMLAGLEGEIVVSIAVISMLAVW
jgi:hypothetical protein